MCTRVGPGNARGSQERAFSDLTGENRNCSGFGLYIHGSTVYGGKTQETKERA